MFTNITPPPPPPSYKSIEEIIMMVHRDDKTNITQIENIKDSNLELLVYREFIDGMMKYLLEPEMKMRIQFETSQYLIKDIGIVKLGLFNYKKKYKRDNYRGVKEAYTEIQDAENKLIELNKMLKLERDEEEREKERSPNLAKLGEKEEDRESRNLKRTTLINKAIDKCIEHLDESYDQIDRI